MHRALPILKCIGILLFLLILGRLDRGMLAGFVKAADPVLLVAALLALLTVFMVKAWRWHILVRATGIPVSAATSWAMFMIGVFLSIFTPAKLGDFGKVAYLKRDGLDIKTGAVLVIVERLADAVLLFIFGIVSAGILFGREGVLIAITALAASIILLAATAKLWKRLATAVTYCIHHHALVPVLMTTTLGWALHFVWAVLLARSVGVSTPIPVLVAALTGASMMSVLPIAPSGLGTRDAALVVLLRPHGVAPEQSVALALLMFAAMILVSCIGMVYWIRGISRDQ
jgi:glycosyltransferase 2 family protein